MYSLFGWDVLYCIPFRERRVRPSISSTSPCFIEPLRLLVEDVFDLVDIVQPKASKVYSRAGWVAAPRQSTQAARNRIRRNFQNTLVNNSRFRVLQKIRGHLRKTPHRLQPGRPADTRTRGHGDTGTPAVSACPRPDFHGTALLPGTGSTSLPCDAAADQRWFQRRTYCKYCIKAMCSLLFLTVVKIINTLMYLICRRRAEMDTNCLPFYHFLFGLNLKVKNLFYEFNWLIFELFYLLSWLWCSIILMERQTKIDEMRPESISLFKFSKTDHK